MKRIKYIGTEKIFIPGIGVGLPSGDNIIFVPEKTARSLLKYRHGGKIQFEEIAEKKSRVEKPVEEVFNDSLSGL